MHLEQHAALAVLVHGAGQPGLAIGGLVGTREAGQAAGRSCGRTPGRQQPPAEGATSPPSSGERAHVPLLGGVAGPGEGAAWWARAGRQLGLVWGRGGRRWAGRGGSGCGFCSGRRARQSRARVQAVARRVLRTPQPWRPAPRTPAASLCCSALAVGRGLQLADAVGARGEGFRAGAGGQAPHAVLRVCAAQGTHADHKRAGQRPGGSDVGWLAPGAAVDRGVPARLPAPRLCPAGARHALAQLSVSFSPSFSVTGVKFWPCEGQGQCGTGREDVSSQV